MIIVGLCLAGLGLTPARFAAAQDWPQILGKNRDAVSAASTSFENEWPAELAPTWTLRLGSGFGGSAIVGQQVLTLHRVGEQEFLESNDLESGAQRWRTGWPTDFEPAYNPDGGPRCVPTVHDGMALCYGAAGDLACVRISDGKLLWLRALRKEYDAEDGFFGAGSSPLVVDDLVVVCLGGKRAGIIGVDLLSGQTRWTSTDYDASYASPIAVNQNGHQMALVVTRLQTVLLNLADGKVLSEVRFGSRGPTVNAATPIQVTANRYLLTASYNVGATLLEIQDQQLTEIFQGSDVLSSQYNTPVSLAGKIIGIDGREDVGRATLKAFDLETKETLWQQPNFGTAHLIACGSQVLALALDGSLTLIDGRSPRFLSVRSAELPNGIYRALPALSANKLIVRSSDGSGSRLMRIDL